MCQSGPNVSNNFNILNSYTLEELEKRVYKNLDQQFGYMNWVDRAIYDVQIQNPQYTRVNKRELFSSAYFNGCPYQ